MLQNAVDSQFLTLYNTGKNDLFVCFNHIAFGR